MDIDRRDFVTGIGLTLVGGRPPLAATSKEATSETAIDSDVDWATVRAQFRLEPGWLHLSQFFLVSHPLPVRKAIERYRALLDANPLMAVENAMDPRGESNSLPERVARSAAEYIGGTFSEVALTDSTTQGLALIYNGLSFAAGDEILVSTHDHFVHHESIRLAAQRSGATMRRIALYDSPARASAAEMVARMRRAIGPRTRVVGLTWVQSSSGVKTPVRAMTQMLADINRSRDEHDRILVVLDAVHGFGNQAEQLAALGVDFAAAGTHKWIFAPRGTGLIWAPERNWGLLRPTIPSFYAKDEFFAWTHGELPTPPTKASWVSPGGFKAYEHVWAMSDAFEFHRRIGRERIADRIAALNSRCKDGLAQIPKVRLHTPRDPALSAGIICFEVEGQTVEETVKRLLDRRVVASTSPSEVPYARLAPSLVNDERDVDAALRAVREVAS